MNNVLSTFNRLVRPAGWTAYLAAYAVGFALGITPKSDIFDIILGFAAFIFSMCFCFILNTIADVDVDKFQNKDTKDIDLSQQPIVTGEVTEKKAIYLSFVFLFLCLICSWFVNIQFFLIFLMINAWGIIYSLPPMRFKARPVGDILVNTMAGGLLFIAGLTIGGDNMFPIIMLVVFISPPIYYIPTPVWDYEFDKKAGLNTSAVYFGPKRLMNARYPFFVLSIIFFIYLILNFDFEIKIFYVVAIVSNIVIMVFPNRKMKDNKVWSNVNWFIYPLFLKSVAFTVYGFLKFFEIFSL